jgi:hypothetical protein
MALLFGFLALLAVGLLLAWWLTDRRRMEMRALGMRLGWSFKYDAGARIEAALRQFNDLVEVSPQAASTLTGWLRIGERRLPAIMGDHARSEEAPGAAPREGKQGSFSYLAVRLPSERTPELVVRRERLVDLPGAAQGLERVHLESEGFNRTFVVRCAQKKFAFAVLHPRMMEFLTAEHAPTIEVRGGWMCITDGARRWRPREFIAKVSWAERFLALWPEYLWEELATA